MSYTMRNVSTVPETSVGTIWRQRITGKKKMRKCNMRKHFYCGRWAFGHHAHEWKLFLAVNKDLQHARRTTAFRNLLLFENIRSKESSNYAALDVVKLWTNFSCSFGFLLRYHDLYSSPIFFNFVHSIRLQRIPIRSPDLGTLFYIIYFCNL